MLWTAQSLMAVAALNGVMLVSGAVGGGEDTRGVRRPPGSGQSCRAAGPSGPVCATLWVRGLPAALPNLPSSTAGVPFWLW